MGVACTLRQRAQGGGCHMTNVCALCLGGWADRRFGLDHCRRGLAQGGGRWSCLPELPTGPYVASKLTGPARQTVADPSEWKGPVVTCRASDPPKRIITQPQLGVRADAHSTRRLPVPQGHVRMCHLLKAVPSQPHQLRKALLNPSQLLRREPRKGMTARAESLPVNDRNMTAVRQDLRTVVPPYPPIQVLNQRPYTTVAAPDQAKERLAAVSCQLLHQICTRSCPCSRYPSRDTQHVWSEQGTERLNVRWNQERLSTPALTPRAVDHHDLQ
jgi:hypothetical protein